MKRKISTSVLLSCLCSGLGQIYCGRMNKGLLLMLAGMTAGLGLPVALLAWSSAWTVVGWTAMAVGLLIKLYATVDAVLLAHRAGETYEPRSYNRWYVYAVFFLFCFPVGVGSAFLARETVVRAYVSVTDSMAPTVVKGDRFIVNLRAYRRTLPAVGDVIVFRSPTRPSVTIIRRVAALGGDVVESVDGQFRINGRDTGVSAPDIASVTVPEGHVYVLSDNDANSSDSRNFGPLPWGVLIGRVEMVYWPRIKSLHE